MPVISRVTSIALIIIISTFSFATPALSAATGPLIVHPDNDRYFMDTSTGETVYVTGSHNWNVLRKNSEPTASTYNTSDYFNMMKDKDHNFLRLWIDGDGAIHHGNQEQYKRSGVCCANDGKNKFDLTRYNQSYFDQLDDVVTEAKRRDIYVAVMLFEAWWVRQKDQVNSDNIWEDHPYNPDNNIHSQTDGTTKNSVYHHSAPSFVTQMQRAYVRKVIDTINKHDNIIWEIANEANASSMSWAEEIADEIRSHEATKPKQHLIGFTGRPKSGPNSELWNSSGDWVSPHDNLVDGEIDDYKTDPPIENHGKVIIGDSDHYWGIGGNTEWVWLTFTRGHNPIFMDPYINDHEPRFVNYDHWEGIRDALGDTRIFARKVADMADMQPSTTLCQTKFCLVDPGNYYIVYSTSSNDFWVNIDAGEYRYEWFDTKRDSHFEGSGVVNVNGGRHTFDPPTDDVVLYLEKSYGSPGGDGDVDGDGDWDGEDARRMKSNFGKTGACSSDSDVTGDCNVDIFDYNKLVSSYGSS